MNEIQKLKALELELLIKKNPTLPYPESFVRYKMEDRTANGLTKLIIRWCQLHGFQAERISVTGRPIDETKIVTDVFGHQKKIGSIHWIPPSMTKGTADISAIIKGKSVKIEVKIGKDIQSEVQKKYQKTVEDAGGLYFIARSFEQIINLLSAIK
ncbi:MAG: hypothetical protein ACOH1N_14165 [Lutibacter sp.]